MKAVSIYICLKIASYLLPKVALATNIPRNTTRGILDKLAAKGIVRKLYKRNTQYYSCKPPIALQEFLIDTIASAKGRLDELENFMPTLTAIHAQKGVIPKVRYFEGQNGVIEAFNHSLYADEKEMLFFTSYKYLSLQFIRKNDEEFYVPMRIKKGMKLRVLVGRTEEAMQFARSDPKELRSCRFIPQTFTLPGNIHVYGDYVVYFSVAEKEHMAVMIESPMMADTMRALFEFMWQKCPAT